MKDLDPFPTAVDLSRAGNTLAITWEDGTSVRFGGEELRWACPCAACRGEAGIPGRLDTAPDLPDEELRLQDVSLVGQYALQIAFASGHGTGIYTFRYLRGLSPQA
jgi:DUF971 family protein